jgi:hypothetical protein
MLLGEALFSGLHHPPDTFGGPPDMLGGFGGPF